MPRLPAFNEFTPGQLGGAEAIFDLLKKIRDYQGDRRAIVEWIRSTWFARSAQSRQDPKARIEQQQKRASNVITGMQQCGLLEKSRNPLVLSALGLEVLSRWPDTVDGLQMFASYLLRERHGMELVQAINDVKSREGRVTRARVDRELAARGFTISNNSTYVNKMRQWLEACGVVDYQWNVDEQVLQALSGASSDDVRLVRSLTPVQLALIVVLRERALGNTRPIQSADLLALLDQRGIEYDRAHVAKKIYEPLVAKGLIVRTVGQDGRGGKGGLIELTPLARSLDVDFIRDLDLGSVPADLQASLGLPTSEIIHNLYSSSTDIKGQALELLALRIASDCGLTPVEMRLRSAQTAGAEVDLVAEATHLHFSRWLFQCKNQASPVPLSVLAKEIGNAAILRAQVVVVVTTGTFARSVYDYARQAMNSTNLHVILLDGRSLAVYKRRGVAGLREVMRDHASEAQRLKRQQLGAPMVS